MASLGLADFAGGTVVHMSAGFSALAAVFVLGNRKKQDYTPHNMVYVAVGVAILWFGWLAFNGGSALGANATAAYALTNSQISAAVGLVTWMALTYRTEKRPTCLGAMMGGLAGLVSVTPGAGYVAPWAAAAMGLIGTACCYFAIQFRIKKNMDDTLDVWGLHGIGGLTGLLLTGVFACPDICAYTGAIYGNPGQIVTQLIGCAVTAVFAFGMTFLIFKGIGALTPLRVSAEVEAKGIDEAVYREKGAVE